MLLLRASTESVVRSAASDSQPPGLCARHCRARSDMTRRWGRAGWANSSEFRLAIQREAALYAANPSIIELDIKCALRGVAG